MDYNQNRKPDPVFFTEGVGNRPESVNDFQPENNLDLSSNRTWANSPRSTESANMIPADERSIESYFTTQNGATIEAVLPPMPSPVAQDLAQIPPQSTSRHFAMSGDRISHDTVAAVSDMVDRYRRSNESAATFYDEVRSAATSFRDNSFGVKK